MPTDADLAPYFRGEKLYGNDFTLEQIEAWYADEAEGYAGLGARDRDAYRYVYHAVNHRHGFRHLPPGPLGEALGIGSAYGDEFVPILDRLDRITIVDPSDAFARTSIDGVPVTYVKPKPSGTLPFDDERFDFVSCLNVLHHIPNVSHVLSELARCLRPGGHMLLSEPVISMGDWRRPRYGLTRRERGIPTALLSDMIERAGLAVISDAYCMNPIVPRIGQRLGVDTFNSPVLTRLDDWLSRATRWNLTYHTDNMLRKVRPTVRYLVLTR